MQNNQPWYKKLWVWVLIFTLCGIAFGIFEPQLANNTKPLIDVFIHIVKRFIGPIVFITVVNGVMGMNDLKELGSIGFKTFLYFEILSIVTLAIGLISGFILRPGANLHFSLSKMNPKLITNYVKGHTSVLDSIIPQNLFTPFITGNTLQILLIAIVFGFILFYATKPWRAKVENFLRKVQDLFFKIFGYVMWMSPLAAFSAMAFMIGQFGESILLHMLSLVLIMLVTCVVFITVVLGIVAKICNFNIFKFLSYIKHEIILVFATSSSESALAPIMDKLTKCGVDKSVVGVVIPSGYSFNLDGTNIYLSLVIAFICQAFDIHLSLLEYSTIVGILMLTSKGAAGVTGSGFIVLAGTLSAIHGKIPVETIVILLGIDKIMSELRATTNLIGNSVATVVIGTWTNKINKEQFKRIAQ